jgi:Rhs element Vgr protein
MPVASTIQSTTSYTIQVDGKKLPLTIQILALRVQTEINRIPTAHLIIIDGEPASNQFETGNSELFTPGKSLDIWAGQNGDEKIIFKGLVVKHGIELRSSGMTRLNVMCKDAFVKMTMTPRRKYFTDKKDSEVIEEIIQSYAGLEVEAEGTSVKYPELIQYDATDWDFIVMRAEANGRVCVVDNGKMAVAKPNLGQEPVLALQYGKDMLDIEAEIDARQQFSSLTTAAWHHADQAPAEATANEPMPGFQGNLSGSDVAKALDAAGTWKYGGKLETEELQAFADAALLKQRMATVRGRVRFFGNADVKPGTLVELKGLSERFNGKAWVSGVQHRLEEGIWTTDIQFGWSANWFSKENDITQVIPPPLLPPITGLQIGVVTGLQDDPDAEERILVRLPMIEAGADGTRARIVSMDAGDKRGFYFRPEIGDEVIVGFLQNDPREAIVLGSLHSSQKPIPPAFQTRDTNHLKGFVSRSEMEMVFDDEKKNFWLKTPEGNQLLMSEDQKQIRLEDQNGNRIVMGPEGIQIESSKDLTLKAAANIKIEGINIEQSASAQWKAAGTAGTEVSSSATAILKGATVLIN